MNAMIAFVRRLLHLSDSTELEAHNETARRHGAQVIERANQETNHARAVIRDLSGRPDLAAALRRARYQVERGEQPYGQ